MSSPAIERFRAAVGEAMRRRDVGSAIGYAEQAIALGLEDPELSMLAAQGRIQNGQFDRALPLLLRARELAPKNVEVLNTLGICHALMGRDADALGVFDAALAVAPDVQHLMLHRAQPLENLGRLREAQASLEQVLAAEPNNPAALEHLANLCARRGDMAKARDYATRALRLAPSAAATVALAIAELADRNFARVHELLAPLVRDPSAGPVNHAIAHGLIGDAFDGEDRPAEAFSAYRQAREALRAPLTSVANAQESAVDRVRRLATYFRSTPANMWRAAPYASPVKTHVFLVGFPRSGTTLLEQALASHGEAHTMEEVDCLGDVTREFFFAVGGMERFAALSDAELEPVRSQYWAAVAASGAQTDRAVFVDKLPLSSVNQGFIARLFPEAKILFALRDPRDVVLSCFRRRLVMSAHMHELLTLEGTAAFYSAVMDLSEVYRDKLGLPTLMLRHEDMLGDFDGEMRRVCEFLGIAFDAATRDFAAHARDRDIKTPSGVQIVRGLNKDGAGQWRRFAADLAPVLPVLEPWVERFGYKD